MKYGIIDEGVFYPRHVWWVRNAYKKLLRQVGMVPVAMVYHENYRRM
jgi:hypothetical protein